MRSRNDLLEAGVFAMAGCAIARRLSTCGGIDTETLAGIGLAAMMANDNDLIRSPPIPV
jgi:hypothetical protein